MPHKQPLSRLGFGRRSAENKHRESNPLIKITHSFCCCDKICVLEKKSRILKSTSTSVKSDSFPIPMHIFRESASVLISAMDCYGERNYISETDSYEVLSDLI